jgi:hypothetical protein
LFSSQREITYDPFKDCFLLKMKVGDVMIDILNVEIIFNWVALSFSLKFPKFRNFGFSFKPYCFLKFKNLVNGVYQTAA